MKCTDGADTAARDGQLPLLENRATTTTVSAGSAGSMIDTKPATEPGGTYAPRPAAATDIAASDKTKQLSTPGTISKVRR